LTNCEADQILTSDRVFKLLFSRTLKINRACSFSAVAQHNLAEYVLLSAPVTSGNNGSPIGSTGVLASDLGTKAVHLIWHESDGCVSSKPVNAVTLAGQISNVTAVQVSGGLNYPQLSG